MNSLMIEDCDRVLRLNDAEEHYGLKAGAPPEARKEVCDRVMHDIRSPLAALAFVTRNLDEIPADKKEIIRASIERIGRIANEFLDWGKSTPDTAVKLPLERHAIGPLIRAAVEEKRMEWTSYSALHLQTEDRATDGDPVAVSMDKSRFLAVLSNLLNNAAEAVQFSGDITLSFCARGNACEIQIQDWGPGMPPDLCARLGKARISVGKTSGNGIGVLSARQAVEEWGGHLDVCSRLGVGTKFRITLPVR